MPEFSFLRNKFDEIVNIKTKDDQDRWAEEKSAYAALKKAHDEETDQAENDHPYYGIKIKFRTDKAKKNYYVRILGTEDQITEGQTKSKLKQFNGITTKDIYNEARENGNNASYRAGLFAKDPPEIDPDLQLYQKGLTARMVALHGDSYEDDTLNVLKSNFNVIRAVENKQYAPAELFGNENRPGVGRATSQQTDSKLIDSILTPEMKQEIFKNSHKLLTGQTQKYNFGNNLIDRATGLKFQYLLDANQYESDEDRKFSVDRENLKKFVDAKPFISKKFRDKIKVDVRENEVYRKGFEDGERKSEVKNYKKLAKLKREAKKFLESGDKKKHKEYMNNYNTFKRIGSFNSVNTNFGENEHFNDEFYYDQENFSEIFKSGDEPLNTKRKIVFPSEIKEEKKQKKQKNNNAKAKTVKKLNVTSFSDSE